MSDKSGNAEKIRDFLQKNRVAHEKLKELQEEMDMLNALDNDQKETFSLDIHSSMGYSIPVQYKEYHAIVYKTLERQMEIILEFKKKLERMACIVEEF